MTTPWPLRPTPWRARNYPAGPPAQYLITPAAQEVCTRAGTDLAAVFAAHAMGDPGRCDVEDRALNVDGWESGGWYMGVWDTGDPDQPTLWLITEPGHGVVTALLPDDY